jgi:hypothetical protein
MSGQVRIGSERPRPVQRRYRQPVFDEEKVGNNAVLSSIQLFAKRRGETDAAGHQKTVRDTNILANGALGALQEFMLVGFNIFLDWVNLVVDDAQAAAEVQDNELFVTKCILNDGFFQFQFGRQQAIVEVPLDRIPFGIGPCGSISAAMYDSVAAREFSHIITNGIPSAKEFFDIRERRNSYVHVLPDNSFSAQITWPNSAATSGTQADSYKNPHTATNYSRIMTYMIGVLLSPL